MKMKPCFSLFLAIGLILVSACTGVQKSTEMIGPALTTQPKSGETDVAVDALILVTFNKDIEIDADTLNTSNVWLLRDGVSPRNITLHFDADTNQLRIDHDLLEEGVTYTVALTNYITSKSGESLGKLIGGSAAETAPQSTPTLPPGSFGSLGALVQSGGQALVDSVANAAYAWQFTTTSPATADLGGGGQTPGTPAPPPASIQPQQDGASCTQDAECTSRICVSGICQAPSCDDGVKNGDESDRDCGGLCNTKCVIGKLCRTDGDCLSNHCDASVCVEPEDHTVSDGGFCLRDDHCLSGTCDTVANKCLAPACDDGIQNADETDIDCGGSHCDACLLGKACETHTDCASGICSPDHLCIDIPDNFVEVGGFCTENAQCKSGVCAGEECRAPSCSDGIVNGNESDVDCGTGCPPCDNGKFCNKKTDCASSFCDNGTCAEPHNLTDGESCSDDPQCLSNYCEQGVCQTVREWTMPGPLSSRDGRPTSLQLGLVGPEASREVYLAFRETDTNAVRTKARLMKADVAHFAPGSTVTEPAPGCSQFNISRKPPQKKTDTGLIEETLQYGNVDVRWMASAYNSEGKASILWLQDMDVEHNRYANAAGIKIPVSNEQLSLTQLFEQKLTEQTSSTNATKIWPPEDLGSEFENGYEVRMAMDNSGNILAAYKLRQDLGSDTVSTLWLIYYNAAHDEWTYVSPISYYPNNWHSDIDSVLNFELAMDPDSGDAVVVWRQLVGDSVKLYSLRFNRDQADSHYQFLGRLDDSDGWGSTYNDFAVAYDAKKASFVAVWRQAVAGQGDDQADFRWARLDRGASAWGSTRTLLSNTARGDGKLYAPKLATDRQGHMFLTWKQFTSNHHLVRVARYDQSWQTPVQLDERSGSHGFTSPSLAMNPYTGEAVVAWMAYSVENSSDKELRVQTYLTHGVRHTGWKADYDVLARGPNLHNVTVGAGRISEQLKSDIMTVVWSDLAKVDNKDKYVIEFSRFYQPPD